MNMVFVAISLLSKDNILNFYFLIKKFIKCTKNISFTKFFLLNKPNKQKQIKLTC